MDEFREDLETDTSAFPFLMHHPSSAAASCLNYTAMLIYEHNVLRDRMSTFILTI